MNDAEAPHGLNGRNRVLAIGAGLSPLWLLALVNLMAPHCCSAMYQPTAAQILAAQLTQLATFGLAAVLMVAGMVVIWRARSTRAVIGAYLLLTIPSVFVLVFAPAFVIILGNLTAGR
jgi:hypothetical protein